MERKKIGFVGAGNMARGILYGLIDTGFIPGERVFIYDVLPAAMEEVKARTGAAPLKSGRAVVEQSDFVVLAVKPQYCESVLAGMGDSLKDKALLSIVSGFDKSALEKLTPQGCRILVIQPTMASMVNAGMTMLSQSHSLREEEFAFAKALFGCIGEVEVLPERLLMVGGTAAGAATAYFYMMIEALADASVEAGLPRDQAYRLCAQAAVGAGRMVRDTKMHPGALKDMVCSPGGSTIRGVHALEASGMRGAVMNAVRDCNNRWES